MKEIYPLILEKEGEKEIPRIKDNSRTTPPILSKIGHEDMYEIRLYIRLFNGLGLRSCSQVSNHSGLHLLPVLFRSFIIQKCVRVLERR